jgi:hypothetical protein
MSAWHGPVKFGKLLLTLEKFDLVETWVPGLKAHGKTTKRIV